MKTWARLFVALVALAIALGGSTSACTTEVDLGTPIDFGSSTFLGASSVPVLTVLANQDTVVWFDAVGNIFSCPKTGCPENAKLLVSSSGFSAGAASASLVNGVVYWAAGSSLKRCALTGCEFSGNTLSTDPAASLMRITTDGKSIAWSTTNGVIWICDVVSCRPRLATRAGCSTSSECPADRPLCSPEFQCVACLDNSAQKGACKAPTPFCGVDQTCVGCDPLVSGAPASACAQGPDKTCDARTRTCVRCATNDDCITNAMEMLASACVGGACVDCDGDYGSGSASPCQLSKPVCNKQVGTCSKCSVTSACADAAAVCRPEGCLTPCTLPSDCTARQRCASSLCIPKLGRGASCSASNECLADVCSGGKCGKPLGAACAGDEECVVGACGADKKCGVPEGGTCFDPGQCRTGSCTARVCKTTISVENALPESILLVDGRLYFSEVTLTSSTTASIVSCAANECPVGVRSVVALPGLSAALVAGDAQSLFFVKTSAANSVQGALMRCELPSCAAPVEMGLDSASGPIQLSTDEIFVFDQAQMSVVRCPRMACASPMPFRIPNANFEDSSRADTALAGHPFAFDSANIYWAANGIFGKRGFLVVATPR